ncbi:hypothetical protein CUC44_18035 [Aeromonas lusitana]|uniref:Uncharacterized protein n=1 Tax=Aeromonas lusitana TaxID=931529 RepID=A0A2M8H5J4_9GAMM|nr:hypothetical protein CUC44_18035 [Aeromonas lusitana]
MSESMPRGHEGDDPMTINQTITNTESES